MAYVNTRLRRYALYAGILRARSVGVYAYEASTGPEQVRHATVHRTFTGLPEGHWHNGEAIARCMPTSQIQTGNPGDD